MKILVLITFLCNWCIITFANPGDSILTLNEMNIINPKVIKEIKRNLKEIRKVYHIMSPTDTFLIQFTRIDDIPYFTIIAKNRKDICKYEIPESEFLGYCKIKRNVFIICGDDYNQVRKKKHNKINFVIYDIPPVIDGYPPCWIYRIDIDEIKLVEKYIPKGKGYNIKFPWI